jgi:hypothetical protein
MAKNVRGKGWSGWPRRGGKGVRAQKERKAKVGAKVQTKPRKASETGTVVQTTAEPRKCAKCKRTVHTTVRIGRGAPVRWTDDLCPSCAKVARGGQGLPKETAT